MVYKCEKCKKVFKQKGHYQAHLLRKKPCKAKTEPKCAICNEVYEGYGNNPYPVCENGRCCDSCNSTKVIPARIQGPYDPSKSPKWTHEQQKSFITDFLTMIKKQYFEDMDVAVEVSMP